jgi:hypothetical protein
MVSHFVKINLSFRPAPEQAKRVKALILPLSEVESERPPCIRLVSSLSGKGRLTQRQDPQNKFAKSGMFFIARGEWFYRPHLACIPPQFHHQNTTTNTRFFPNPHQKTPVKPENRFDGRL